MDTDLAQNIYDTPEFFDGYSRLDRSVRGLDGGPEWPALRALLPDLRGKRLLDLGCGFGWIARWAMSQGAAGVLGVDLSENMLSRARAETADPGVRYLRADLESLELPEAAFDVAYSSLALHYVEDFAQTRGRGVSRARLRRAFRLQHRASDLYGVDERRMADDRRMAAGPGRSIITPSKGRGSPTGWRRA